MINHILASVYAGARNFFKNVRSRSQNVFNLRSSDMLLGRAAIYFDEVARRRALRRAAASLHIAPSAIDRQIMQLEDSFGTKLFERTPNGMRMTAAGELLVDGVRRWRRDLQRPAFGADPQPVSVHGFSNTLCLGC